jgi:diacylglycerol kinase family enzyme
VRSLLLVANPAASGFTRESHRKVAAALAHSYEVDAVWPSSAQDARRMAAEAVAAGVAVVAAMGGDGILHHVAQELVGTATVLGVIPAGTANVLARQLDIPVRAAAAARMLAAHHRVTTIPVLAADCSGPTRTERRIALFSFGVGADAEVVEAAEADPFRKRGLGPFHYLATAIGQVRHGLGRRRPDLTVTAGDRTAAGIGAMAQFGASYTYFGPFAMRLSARPPDPITLLVVEEMRVRRGAAMIASTVGSAGLESVRGFQVWHRIDRFDVEAAIPAVAQADGEILGRFVRVAARLVPAGLSVAIPAPG